jgi:hypothetical protein
MKKNRIVRNTLPVALIYGVLFLLVLAGCALPLGEDFTIDAKKSEGTNSYVMDYNLQVYVPIPTAGAAAVKTVSTRRDMEISVKWLNANSGADITGSLSEFAEGASYKAEITVKARPGWSFDPAVRFAYPEGTVAGQPPANTAADTRILAVSYKPTGAPQAIVGEDLARYIPSPASGVTPVVSFSGSRYTGSVEWMEGDVPIPPGNFLPGVGYKAAVTLNAGPGYTFAGIPDKPGWTTPVAGAFSHGGSTGLIHGAGGGGALEVLITFNETGPAAVNYVVDYDLQHYVPVPVTGAVPVEDITRPDMNVTVVWKDGAGSPVTQPFNSFAQGADYQADITLTANSGWSFVGINFAYPAGSVATQPGPDSHATTRDLTVTYKTTAGPVYITTVGDLAVHIPAPVSGATAVKSFAAVQYSGAVTWQYKNGAAWQAMTGTLFQPDTEYKAGVTLYPAPGHAFSGSAVPIVGYTGGSLVGSGSIVSGGSITGIGIEFAATGKIPVNDRDLTARVPQPVKGNMAVSGISSFQYTATNVTWTPSTPDPRVNGFQGGETYSVTVNLSAASGYTFTGVSSFTHGGALNGGDISIFTNNGDTAAFTIYFPPVPTDTTVTDLDLTAKIPRPVSGGTPATYFSWPQYTGTKVSWEKLNGTLWEPMLGGTFQADTAYRAVFDLSAASGYTFAGIGGNTFTYTGTGVTVTHGLGAANTPLRVTLEFLVAVNIFNLTSYLPAPVRGVASTGLTPTGQYTGTVAWNNVTAGGTLTTGAPFGTETVYEAVLTLTVKDGYVFGVGANAFTHSGAAAGYPTNAAGLGDTLAITVRFPATAKALGFDTIW